MLIENNIWIYWKYNNILKAIYDDVCQRIEDVRRYDTLNKVIYFLDMNWEPTFSVSNLNNINV